MRVFRFSQAGAGVWDLGCCRVLLRFGGLGGWLQLGPAGTEWLDGRWTRRRVPRTNSGSMASTISITTSASTSTRCAAVQTRSFPVTTRPPSSHRGPSRRSDCAQALSDAEFGLLSNSAAARSDLQRQPGFPLRSIFLQLYWKIGLPLAESGAEGRRMPRMLPNRLDRAQRCPTFRGLPAAPKFRRMALPRNPTYLTTVYRDIKNLATGPARSRRRRSRSSVRPDGPSCSIVPGTFCGGPVNSSW